MGALLKSVALVIGVTLASSAWAADEPDDKIDWGGGYKTGVDSATQIQVTSGDAAKAAISQLLPSTTIRQLKDNSTIATEKMERESISITPVYGGLSPSPR